MDFYPRPHMEGDASPLNLDLVKDISTHALTWRATTLIFDDRGVDRISTHALTWRATCADGAKTKGANNFYPRPHMEGDLSNSLICTVRRYFYPRPHMEGDGQRGAYPQRGGDFYPRPHMEGDIINLYSSCFTVISTHALTWRATASSAKIVSCSTTFLPTPSHGGRHVFLRVCYIPYYFYPRPHMEGDAGDSGTITITISFLPTPSHGGRLATAALGLHTRIFLPTPSHGGRLVVMLAFLQNH